MRIDRNRNDLFARKRRGHAAEGMAVALAGIVAIGGVLGVGTFFLAARSAPAPMAVSIAPSASMVAKEPIAASDLIAESDDLATSASETRPQSLLCPIAPSDLTVGAGSESLLAEAAPAVPAKDAAALWAQVDAQLAAGEFGPALAAIREVSDARERTQLLKKVAQAQQAAGDFDSALDSIRRMPVPEERIRARGATAAERSLAGGAAEADFDALIDLIMNETSGPWLEVDGTGGTITPNETGIRVDPAGLLHRLTTEERTGRLASLGRSARRADLNDDMRRTSPLRLVSLTRLEAEIARRLAQGEPVLETMKHLAGLSRIQYVFVFPEDGEIVLGGPAEGWRIDETGLAVGTESGRPTLHLDDLVTVARTFGPGGSALFTCAIVPRQEGLKKVQDHADASRSQGSLSPAQVSKWVGRMQELLGVQDVVFTGVPAESRVAHVMVEADYRMKLVGIGKLAGVPGSKSYFDLLSADEQKSTARRDALRWWLTMKYEALLHSPDRNVFEVRGSSVQCLSENELIGAQGERISTGKTAGANERFAANFTEHYAELAGRDLVFADLQNIFDLALVAALVRQERLADRLDWDGGAFASNGAYRPAVLDPVLTADTVVNHRVYPGGHIVVQVAGGVRADLLSVLRNERIVQSTPRLASVAKQGRAPQLPEGRWWWDAAR